MEFRAEELRNLFSVSRKAFYMLKAEALAQEGKWGDLDKVVSSKSSKFFFPFDYLYLTELCLRYRNSEEALKYALLIPVPSQKLELLLELEAFDEAVDLCVYLKDTEAAKVIVEKCREEAVLTKLTSGFNL